MSDCPSEGKRDKHANLNRFCLLLVAGLAQEKRGICLNGERMYVNRSPVGYTAYPYPVGAKGTVFHINLEINL